MRWAAVTEHQRDVVFTPFMLRVRDALVGESPPTTLHVEPSRPQAIAVAVNEWFELRARAEHVIAEANAMLAEGAERIELEDEFGTDHLSFVLRWRDRALRIGVDQGGDRHSGQVITEESSFGVDRDVKPMDNDFLEDIAVALLSLGAPGVEVVQAGDSA